MTNVTDSSVCPSDKCWDHVDVISDQETLKACLIKPECASVTCNADSMTIRYKNTLLGDKEVFSNHAATAVDGQFSELTCPLGHCGMTYKVENDR